MISKILKSHPNLQYDKAEKIYHSVQTAKKLFLKSTPSKSTKQQSLAEKLQDLSTSSSLEPATTSMLPLLLKSYASHLKQDPQPSSKEPVEPKTKPKTDIENYTTTNPPILDALKAIINENQQIILTPKNKTFLKKFIQDEMDELEHNTYVRIYRWIDENKKLLQQEEIIDSNTITTIEYLIIEESLDPKKTPIDVLEGKTLAKINCILDGNGYLGLRNIPRGKSLSEILNEYRKANQSTKIKLLTKITEQDFNLK